MINVFLIFNWLIFSSITQALSSVATVVAVIIALKPYKTDFEILFIEKDDNSGLAKISIINHSFKMVVVKSVRLFDHKDTLTFIDYFSFHKGMYSLVEIPSNSIRSIDISPNYLIHHYGHGLLPRKVNRRDNRIIIEVELSNGKKRSLKTELTFDYLLSIIKL